MATFAQMHQRFAAFNINKTAMETLEQKRSDVVARNVAQMMEGEDKLGGVLYEYKSYRYSVEKHSMNSRPGFGFADGRYTGKFHESLKLQIEDEKKYTITATDAKTAKLIKLFGTKMFGLNEESRDLLVNKSGYRSLFNDNVRRKLNL